MINFQDLYIPKPQILEEWEHQGDAWAAVLNINKGTDAAGQKGRKRNLHPLSTLRRRGYLFVFWI